MNFRTIRTVLVFAVIGLMTTSCKDDPTSPTQLGTVSKCEALPGSLEEGGFGDYSSKAGYGSLSATASAVAGGYSSGSAEFVDRLAVVPDDASLIGTYGVVHVKTKYVYDASGTSDSRPAGRITVFPRDATNSSSSFEKTFGTASDGRLIHGEDEWVIPLSVRFRATGSQIQFSCDVFARSETSSSSLALSFEWLGIEKITAADGTIIANYSICSGSGTDYTGNP